MEALKDKLNPQKDNKKQTDADLLAQVLDPKFIKEVKQKEEKEKKERMKKEKALLKKEEGGDVEMKKEEAQEKEKKMLKKRKHDSEDAVKQEEPRRKKPKIEKREPEQVKNEPVPTEAAPEVKKEEQKPKPKLKFDPSVLNKYK